MERKISPNMEKMKTGEMNDSADVVHNLLLRSKEKHSIQLKNKC